MPNKKLEIPYKKIRVIQFLFKTYLDKATARKYYVILNVFQSTGSQDLLGFIKQEIEKIKSLPDYDPSQLKY